MVSDQLRHPNPTSDAARGLNELLDQRAQLAATAADAERRVRFASGDVQQASDAVTEIERRALGGEKVSDAERAKVHKRLVEARAAANEPWSQRAEGGRRALSDLDRRIAAHVVAHFDQLRADVEAEAVAVAERLDRAAQEVVDAHTERAQVEGRLLTLASTVARVRPGDVFRSRADALAREAGRLLGRDGEQPPTLAHDPRAPRGGSLPAGPPAAGAWEETFA
jgi:hypothetical protein